ncbi:metal-dependent hydrolase [Patescibacteria group bacterium]
MFLAHLPAGYLLTKKLQKHHKIEKYLALGLFASILPDLDLVWWALIDNSQHFHHSYWIHIPFYWLIIGLIALAIIKIAKRDELIMPLIVFMAGIFLHLILDTFVGGIKWLYPFSYESIFIANVPAVYDYWVWNFILHWTFLLEVVIFGWAGVKWRKSKLDKRAAKCFN